MVKFVSILSPSRRKAITAQTTFLHQLVILSTSQSLICKLTGGIVLAPCRGSKVSMKSRLGCSGMRPGWIISALPAWAKKTGGLGVSSSYSRIKYINKDDSTVISHQSPADWAMLQVDERPAWKRACLRIQTWAHPCQKGSPSPLEQVNRYSCGTYDDLPHWYPHPGRRGHGRCLDTLPQRVKTVPPHPLGGQNATSRPGQQTHSRFMQSKMQASRMCISSICTTSQLGHNWLYVSLKIKPGVPKIFLSAEPLSHKIFTWRTPWDFELIIQWM